MRASPSSFVVLLLLIALGLPGCAYRYQFDTGRAPSGERVSEWRHIGIWGYVRPEPFDLEAACPGGVARFGSHINFLNWLPAFFTIGLWAPRTVWAECAAQGAVPAAPATEVP